MWEINKVKSNELPRKNTFKIKYHKIYINLKLININ